MVKCFDTGKTCFFSDFCHGDLFIGQDKFGLIDAVFRQKLHEGLASIGFKETREIMGTKPYMSCGVLHRQDFLVMRFDVLKDIIQTLQGFFVLRGRSL